MTKTDDLAGTGEILESLGKVWTLAHVGPVIKGKFAAWLKGRARRELADQLKDGVIDASEHREAMKMLMEQQAGGAYNWGSPFMANCIGSAVESAMQQTECKMRLVQLMMEPKHGEVDLATIQEVLADAQEAAQVAIEACLNPNRKAPAAASQPGVKLMEAGKAAG